MTKEDWKILLPLIEAKKLILYSKADEWFDEGTEVEYLGAFMETFDGRGNLSPSGLFRGLRNNNIDEEMCGFDEFVLEVL